MNFRDICQPIAYNTNIRPFATFIRSLFALFNLEYSATPRPWKISVRHMSRHTIVDRWTNRRAPTLPNHRGRVSTKEKTERSISHLTPFTSIAVKTEKKRPTCRCFVSTLVAYLFPGFPEVRRRVYERWKLFRDGAGEARSSSSSWGR